MRLSREDKLGGMYLTQSKTVKRCRTEFFLPDLMNRKNYDDWRTLGKKKIDEAATSVVEKRLSTYKKPEIDPQIEKDLSKYVAKRKGLKG